MALYSEPRGEFLVFFTSSVRGASSLRSRAKKFNTLPHLLSQHTKATKTSRESNSAFNGTQVKETPIASYPQGEKQGKIFLGTYIIHNMKEGLGQLCSSAVSFVPFLTHLNGFMGEEGAIRKDVTVTPTISHHFLYTTVHQFFYQSWLGRIASTAQGHISRLRWNH